MQLLDLIRQRTPQTAEPQRPGRHSEAGLIDRLRQEVAELTAQRDEARGRSDYHLGLLKRRDAEVRHLRTILGEDAHMPPVNLGPGGDPASWPHQPDPEPISNGPRACPDTPPGPVDSEAADVNAETQPVPQIDLARATGMDDTVRLPAVVPVRPVVLEPLPPVTWGRSTPFSSGAATEVLPISATVARFKVAAAVSETP